VRCLPGQLPGMQQPVAVVYARSWGRHTSESGAVRCAVGPSPSW
jgi:hypothetical protein